MFRTAPPLELKKLGAVFRHNVFKMLLARGKIGKEIIAILSTWKHSGCNVFCSNRISPNDDKAMENLACYIIRASGGDMLQKPKGSEACPRNKQDLDQKGEVVYTVKKDNETNIFSALEWLANLCSHIPNLGGQMVR